MRSTRGTGLLAGIVLAALAGCGDGSTSPPEQRRLFERYVALGNSITAGFESGGINDSTQAHAYPVLLAARAGVSFETVRIRKPGCPAPLLGPIATTGARVGGASASACAGPDLSSVPLVIQNLGVPGIRIADAVSIPSSPMGQIYAQALRGRTLIQAAVDARPSLVSVWLGNNDALGAATSGNPADPGSLTPLASFEASLDAVVTAIAAIPGLRDAVLIGVVDPQLAPIVQPGAYFWLLYQNPATRPLLPKPVSANCAPLTPAGQPNPLASNLVSFRVAEDPAVVEISCADTAPYLLNAAERQTVGARVADFNSAIERRAAQRGWTYVDADALLRARLADPRQLRRCQGLAGAQTLAQVEAAAVATCPGPSAPNFFGELISYDAVHPSLAGQRVIAEAIAAALRSKHGDL